MATPPPLQSPLHIVDASLAQRGILDHELLSQIAPEIIRIQVERPALTPLVGVESLFGIPDALEQYRSRLIALEITPDDQMFQAFCDDPLTPPNVKLILKAYPEAIAMVRRPSEISHNLEALAQHTTNSTLFAALIKHIIDTLQTESN